KICDFFALLKAYHFMLFCTFPILIASLYVGFKSKFESLKIFYIGFLGLGVIAGFEIFRFYFAITEMERLNSFLIGIIIMISCTFLSFALSAKEKMQAQFENEIYKKLANTDQLTSIRNRLAFDTSLQRYSESNDIFNSITFAFIDVNNFKTINDTYGHAVGDTVLQKIATALDEQFSHFASCYRIGGDEFCILAINCDEETIAEYLNIVNQNLKQEITDFSVSVSYGISTCNGNDVDTLYNSFKLADHRMYQQKDQYKKNKKMKTKSHTN
ncbi:MAG: GGDEF domain-containing protein, partial [Oscillospiraceae bacterium]